MTANMIKHLDWDLQDALEQCGKSFSGKLIVRSSYGYEWGIHFFMGRIVGESAGVHTARRWQRLFRENDHLANKISQGAVEFSEFLKDTSTALERMVKRGQISREQALSLAKASILDSLFDILHLQWLCRQSADSRLFFSLVTESDPKKGVLPWLFFRTSEIYQDALGEFFVWQQNSLGRFSPNLAPAMKGLVPLNASTLEKNLLALVDGELTVRDLAVRLDRNPLEVMQIILPLVDRGIVVLKAIPDCIAQERPAVVRVKAGPAVAFVDDNPMEGKILGSILAEMGCKFVPITDPLKALPELLKAKPSLIFLDLVMPIVNGYEVCAQVRRVALFADTPVIILTGNDGIIDRVRAKVVGATEFLSKPIDRVKIHQMLTKYGVIKTIAPEGKFQPQLSY